MAIADPWALLREAQRLIAANRLMLGHYSGVREVGSLEDRIDAALAERQDSAKDVVEWTLHDSGTSTARFNGCPFTVYQQDERWCWEVACSTPDWYKEVTSHAATEAEARRAATAAVAINTKAGLIAKATKAP